VYKNTVLPVYYKLRIGVVKYAYTVFFIITLFVVYNYTKRQNNEKSLKKLRIEKRSSVSSSLPKQFRRQPADGMENTKPV
jgi:hypothetical protein